MSKTSLTKGLGTWDLILGIESKPVECIMYEQPSWLISLVVMNPKIPLPTPRPFESHLEQLTWGITAYSTLWGQELQASARCFQPCSTGTIEIVRKDEIKYRMLLFWYCVLFDRWDLLTRTVNISTDDSRQWHQEIMNWHLLGMNDRKVCEIYFRPSKKKKTKDDNQKEVKIEEEGSVIMFSVCLCILRAWRWDDRVTACSISTAYYGTLASPQWTVVLVSHWKFWRTLCLFLLFPFLL